MKRISIILAIVAVLVLGLSVGSTARKNPQTASRLRSNCQYPYSGSGFLTNECKQLINQALAEGYSVGHNTAEADGYVNMEAR